MLNRRPLDPKKLAPFQRSEDPPQSLAVGNTAHKKSGSSEPPIQGAPAAKRPAVPPARKLGTAPAKAMAAAAAKQKNTPSPRQQNQALMNGRYVCTIFLGYVFINLICVCVCVCVYVCDLIVQQVVEQVGAGANGVVVRALDTKTGGVVAIKSIKTVCFLSFLTSC